MSYALHQFLPLVHEFLRSFLPFLPLFTWAILAFGILYSLLETDFRPLAILFASVIATARILTGRRRVTVALLAVFAAERLVEALALLVLKLQGQPLLITVLTWQGIMAGAIAWIATYIHSHTLPLPERNSRELLHYRVMSLVAGVTLFLFGLGLAIGSLLALQALGVLPRFHVGYLVAVAQTLIFVPMALIRPALSLGLPSPVRKAVFAAARPPFVIAAWVTALGLPMVGFNWVGLDIVRAHPSEWSILAYKAVRVAYSVFNCTFFETTTLLLLARETNGLLIPGDE